MIFIKSIYKSLLVSIIFFMMSNLGANSQSWYSEVSQSGFILKKVVSDTIVPSGQSFSYTIYYTIPAGATNVTITDNLPPGLQFLGFAVNNACGTPTVNSPLINSMGGNFSISWPSIPNGCVGSFTITVAFPNGVTCPGTTVRNRACIMAILNNKDYEFCTNFLSTSATATNPWAINKYPLGLAWVGGNCPWATGSDTVTYQVCVYKAVGTTGQLNLVNAVVTDTLPTGAQMVSSTCGATQTGNVITWNVGNMSALPAYNSVCCQFTIYYPLAQFPNGSSITNKANLIGSLGPQQSPCSNFTTSASTCVNKQTYQSATISKWTYTNRQPGCAGQYLIYICNSGTTNLPVVALDTLPTSLSGYSIGTVWPASMSATLNSGIVTITGTLAPGQCAYVAVNFTIPANAVVGSTITNCVYLTSMVPNQSACTSFIVDTPAPKACLWKEVCQKQVSYTPGSTFRYRLRIQNIGGQTLSGTTLTDVLDQNLEYVGNPSYYTANTWSIPNCKPNPNAAEQWTGVTLSYNSGNNTVTATMPNIAAICQNIFYSSCGMYGTGGVPYYYIEFDVKVRDTAAMGNIPNKFTLAGGTLGAVTETSNIEYVLVIGVVGFNLQKGVKKPTDTNYTTSAMVTPGANINYKLKMNSSGTAALGHITFVDLMPKNAGAADQLILAPCSNRNSQFDITYNSIIGIPIPSPAFPLMNATTSIANVNNLAPTGAPGNSFTTGCGTNGSWAAGSSVGMKNFAIYFGATAVGLTGAEYQFLAHVDSTAKAGQNSCNTFAASGWTKHLIQSSILSYQIAGELESPTACVSIDSTQQPSGCLKDVKIEIKCKDYDQATGAWNYTINLSASSCVNSTLLVSSPHGTISPASYNLTSSPWTISMNFLYTSAVNPITINYTLLCNGIVCRDSIRLDVPPCKDPPIPSNDCCKEFKHTIKDPKLTWNSATGYVGLSASMFAGPNPIQKFSATIVNAQLRRVCGNSTGAWTRIFGDISGGSLITSPGAGPQLLSIYSREAVWGSSDSCVDWNNSANLSLNMLFPPFSGFKYCRDTLMFSIRYSFTDCKCVTCDTVVQYSVVRKLQLIAWDPIDHWIKTGKLSVNEGKINGNEDNVLQTLPEKTSLEMEDSNNGTFWIISPNDSDNNITIHGLELTSQDVEFESITNNGESGITQGNVAFISLLIKPGQTSNSEIKFNNPEKLNKFFVYARFLYSIEGDDQQIFSQPIAYLALVPGVAPDKAGVDLESKPIGVRTYSLYLHNANGYKEPLSALQITTAAGTQIIAVGPPNVSENGVLLFPKKLENGSYIISTETDGELVAVNDIVKPIYLTLSGITDKDPIVDFDTYDEFGNIISKGKIQLSDPVSKVKDDITPGDDNSGISVYPNPADDNLTLTLNTANYLNNAVITVRDINGKIVIPVKENLGLQSGTHIFNINISSLTNGTYFIDISNNIYSKTTKFVINR